MDMKINTIGAVILAFILTACGGGGGSGGSSGAINNGTTNNSTANNSTGNNGATSSAASSSSSSVNSGSTETSGGYSLALDKTIIKLDVYWDYTSTTQIVKVDYKGDGVIVGIPPGGTLDPNLQVDTQVLSDTSVALTFKIRAGQRYDGPTTLKTKMRVVTGKADGSKVLFKDIDVTIEQHDGLILASEGDNLKFNPTTYVSTWGSQTPKYFVIDSKSLNWSIKTDIPGLSFEPASGTGYKSVKMVVDYKKVPLTLKKAQVAVSATSGEKSEGAMNITLTPPSLYGLGSFQLRSKKFGSSQTIQEMPLTLTGETKVTWSVKLPAWAAAVSTSGLTDQDRLKVYVNDVGLPATDGAFNDEVIVSLDVPGGPVIQKIPISLEFQQHRLQADRNAIAFSDYGTHDAQAGSFSVNVPAKIPLVATANQSWIIIDGQKNSSINFHLNTSVLADGFHTAEITVATQDSSIAVADKVSVGYYKTSAALKTGKIGALPNVGYSTVVVADKLGPWIYFYSGTDTSAEIVKYNLITQQRDAGYALTPGYTSNILAMTISDDGKYLYSADVSGKNINVFDLALNQKINSYPTENHNYSSNEKLGYARFDGKAFLSRASGIMDAVTGEQLQNLGFLYGGDTAFNRIVQNNYHYNYLTKVITPWYGNIPSDMPSNESIYLHSTAIGTSSNSSYVAQALQRTQGGGALALFSYTDLLDETPTLKTQASININGIQSDARILTTNKGGVAVVLYEQVQNSWQTKLSIFDKKLTEKESFIIDSLGLFLLSSDEKFIVYMEGDYAPSAKSVFVRSIE